MKKVLERIVAQPGAPLENEIWLDTSQNPAVMKYWDGDEWKPIAGGEGGESVPESVLTYLEQSLTNEQKAQARSNIGAAEAGAGCDCTWISLLPHLTADIPEDLSTIDPENGGEPIVLYEFTSEEDYETNDPYAYINEYVYPVIFVNDYLLGYNSDDDWYECKVSNGSLLVYGDGPKILLESQGTGGGGQFI